MDLDEAGHYDLKHSNPDWSPDGTRLAFDSNRSGNFDIYVTNDAGGSLIPIPGRRVS